MLYKSFQQAILQQLKFSFIIQKSTKINIDKINFDNVRLLKL